MALPLSLHPVVRTTSQPTVVREDGEPAVGSIVYAGGGLGRLAYVLALADANASKYHK